jgi:hypothetical protein
MWFKNKYKPFFWSAIDGADVDGSVWEFFVYVAPNLVAPGGEGLFYIQIGLSCCDVFGTVTNRDEDPVRTAQ